MTDKSGTNSMIIIEPNKINEYFESSLTRLWYFKLLKGESYPFQSCRKYEETCKAIPVDHMTNVKIILHFEL